MSPFALKEQVEGEGDFEKQRNLPFYPVWVHGEADIFKDGPLTTAI